MKYKFLYVLVTTLVSTFLSYAEDTIQVYAHESTQMNRHGNYDNKVYFPTEGSEYRKVYMYFTLGCADGGCSDWDYDVLTQIMHNTGKIDSTVTKLDTISLSPLVVDTTWKVFNVLEPYELGRFITPYGSYMNFRNPSYGNQGFDSSWNHTFRYDVTDYASLLKDSVIIRAKYNGWSAGFSADIRFEFIKGTPQRPVIAIKNLYTKGGRYVSSEQFERDIIPARKLEIPYGTKSAVAKVLVTGHGNNSGTNCGEFCDKDYYFKVNGEQMFTHRMWREDCGIVPVRPQGGTYLYSRANWCPGDKVHEQRWELTSFLNTDSIELDMDIESYTNEVDGGNSSHNISSTVFFYGSDNYTFDAEINTIIAPSTHSEHINYNPSCGQVIVVIKNNAHAPLTSTKIRYGALNGKMRTEVWTGNLAFEEMDTVYLPSPYWDGVSMGTNQFMAELVTPNQRYNDENKANNKFVSTFNLAPRWEPFRFMLRTNGYPQENKLTITNERGEVVWEKSDFEANKNFIEDVTLPSGCFELLLSDDGNDGLDWWVYRQTGQTARANGSFRVFKQSGGVYAFASDFGNEFRMNFIVGQMDIQEAPIEMSEDFEIYPNPTSGRVNVHIPELNEGNAEIEVFDMLGRRVLSFFKPTDIEHLALIDISELMDNMYVVKVTVGDQSVSEKILKITKW
ncbi:MAG: peptide-N-glycosidase F-related protein [Bacteroidia bacterium]|nr:peptide-N-glycosidase F-related protein [Bacteroidia bacterium]